MRSSELRQALETLGHLLIDRELSFELTVIGAGSMLLTNLLDRATRDLDVVCVRSEGIDVAAQPMPDALVAAVQDVARLHGLDDDWLNSEPADIARLGFPDGFHERTTTATYGALIIHHAGRIDQICFKLYALVDRGPRSKHADDLRKLRPTREELLRAARWTRSHDPSPGFRGELHAALEFMGIIDHGEP